LETPSQIGEAMKLPSSIVTPLLKDAVDRKLIEAMGQADTGIGALAEMRYGMAKLGRDWAVEALEQSQYFGPAPVSLETYQNRIQLQCITNEWVSRSTMKEAFQEIVIPERFVTRLGPAINSGTAILIYGPAGNGKTTVAEIVGQIFQNVIYVPYCFEVDGQIVKVYDPSVHRSIEDAGGGNTGLRGLRRERVDKRWVPCYRLMVITGGELTLDMLDLKFNEIAKFYEAPMHIKALNGTFLIDDFGRQRVKPEDILNRWIVPLASRVDYLNLHTGKSFELPFDELV
jgi:predicted ATPase with chaperone activity